MNIYHPLASIPEGLPTALAFVGLAVLVLISGKLAGPHLDAPGLTHRKIIALERPANAREAHAVIREWEGAGKLEAVRRSIRWDSCFFIPVYIMLTALAGVIAARAFFDRGSGAYHVALALAWLPLLAGALDWVENYAMLRMLGGFEGEAPPRLAWWCATVKFAIILTLGAWGATGALVAGARAVWPSAR